MNLILSDDSIDLIVSSEVSSRAYYNKLLQHPKWPGGASGVTIGIGYDLGQHEMATITADWGHLVSSSMLGAMMKCTSKTGNIAATLVKDPSVSAITIDFDTAKKVFISKALPQYVKMTLHAYPGLDQLEPDAIGALVSMIYNRGGSLTGPDRIEMANIVPLVTSKDYAGIADQVEHSKRLWEGKPAMAGLVARRIAEATMIRGCVRTYQPEELITVTV